MVRLSLTQPCLSSTMRHLLLVFVMVLTCAGAVAAHEIRPTIADFEQVGDDQFQVSISLNVEATIAQIGSDHSDTDDSPNAAEYETLRGLEAAGLESRLKAFLPTFLDQAIVRIDDQTTALELLRTDIPDVGDLDQPRHSTIVLAGRIPPGAVHFVWAWPKGYGQSVIRTNYRVREDDGPAGFAAFFQDGETSEPIPFKGIEQSGWEIFVTYLEVGFTHIVPLGLDHILFVIGLFLLSTRLSPLLWQVTSFTLAHSVTLALGVFGLVQISPAIVEPLIAASIVYVCVENILTDKLQKWRPLVVFGFGLLHGLGFAGVLQEIGLVRDHYVIGLLAFNVGVEIGQLAVIALCFTAVGVWFRHKIWYRERITTPVSMVIAVIGAWWFIERTILA